MRILHVLDHSVPLQSGYSFRTIAILEQQRKRGWQTFQLTGPKHYATKDLEETVDGFEFFRSVSGPLISRKLPVLNHLAVVSILARRLEEVILRVKPDLLHAHSPALNGLAALRVGRRRSLPVIYEVRAFWEDAAVNHGTARDGGMRYRLGRALETHVLRRADAITTICEGLRGEISRRGIPRGGITVVPNAVDPEKFRSDTRDDPGLADALGLRGATVFGFIGSFYEYEGLVLLLDALRRLLDSGEDVRLLLVGGGPQESALRERAYRRGLSERVVFVGRVPHGEVAQYYGLIDIFVYPRLPMRLTNLVTPLKPLEALAQGCIVVASNVGGHRELLVDGVTGYLFPAGDVEELASALRRILAARSDWPRIREAGRRFVERERSWAASVARYEQVYDSVLRTGRAC